MPKVDEFIPSDQGCDEIIEMTVDEYETIRLIDHLEYSQEQCAQQMNVARTTIQAVYDSARKKLADVLVEGKRLKIGGGSYEVCPKASGCCRRQCERAKCKSTERECKKEEYCAGI